jgi:hypothetical protein
MLSRTPSKRYLFGHFSQPPSSRSLVDTALGRRELMATCKNHPQTPASGRCSGCAEEFCQNCLVDIQGQKYCGSCKVMALQGKTPTAVMNYQEAVGNQPNKLAKEALTYGIVSLLCCGIILGPIAIVKANQAKAAIAQDPNLGGAGMATAGMILGVIGTIGGILIIGVRVAAMSSR